MEIIVNNGKVIEPDFKAKAKAKAVVNRDKVVTMKLEALEVQYIIGNYLWEKNRWLEQRTDSCGAAFYADGTCTLTFTKKQEI